MRSIGALVVVTALLWSDSRADRPMARADRRVLRVCADPNNLPLSNRAGQGFEDELAQLFARELGARLEHVFWAQRRGFFRNTLNAGRCDVVMGVPSDLELVRTTRPYYASRYAFVTRRDRALRVRSLGDQRLARWSIGIHVVGDESASTPPALGLSRRGIIDNVVGFNLYGDYASPSPTVAILDAVRDGAVDAALVWGPLAADAAPELRVEVIEHARDAGIPFEFAIALGVRKRDAGLQRELDAVIAREREAIEAVLTRHRVPHIELPRTKR
jgi:mxaJ protein